MILISTRHYYGEHESVFIGIDQLHDFHELSNVQVKLAGT